MKNAFNTSAGAFLLCLVTAGTASAWDAQGHRLTANLAYERLTPAAKTAVRSLIAKDAVHRVDKCPVASLADAAVWPDCVRGLPEFDWLRPMHYDDIPLFGRENKATYCPEGQCASASIEAAIATVKNQSLPDKKRLLALYEIAHLVGDIHQPLHAADNGDQGGNAVRVIYLGETEHFDEFKRRMVPYNLHFIWDTSLVANALGNDGRQQIETLANQHALEWSKGDADAWAMEAHEVAVDFAYGGAGVRFEPGRAPADAVNIGRDYVNASEPIVREQLAKAGVRLAVVLNSALGSEATTEEACDDAWTQALRGCAHMTDAGRDRCDAEARSAHTACLWRAPPHR